MNVENEKKRAEIESMLLAHLGDGAIVMLGRIPEEKLRIPKDALSAWDVVWGPAMTLGDVRCLRAVPILDKNGEISGWRIRLFLSFPWWDTPNGINAHRRYELERWTFSVSGMPSVFFGAGGERAVMIQGLHKAFAEDDQQETIEEYARWRAHRLKNATEFADLDHRVLEFEAEVMAEEDAHAKS